MKIIKDKRNWKVQPILDNLKCPYLYYPANIHGCKKLEEIRKEYSNSCYCNKDECPIKFNSNSRKIEQAYKEGVKEGRRLKTNLLK